MTYKLTKTSLNPDPYYGAVSLLLNGDGANNSTDIRDSSRSTKAISVAGNAKISTAQSKWNGSSLSFNGSISSYAGTAFSSDLYIGTDVFTIEFWFYANSTANETLVFCNNGPPGFPSWGNTGWWFNTYNGKIQLSGASTGPKTVTGYSTNSITANTWHHVAAVKDVAAGKYYIYLDGIQNAGFSIATSGDQLEPFTASTPPAVYFGAAGPGWNFGSFNGYIDDFRFTKGVARYTSNFTPPTQPFQAFNLRDPYFNSTSLLLHGDGPNNSTNVVDSSYSTKTITVVGDAKISTAQSKFGGSSLAFDGTGDYLTAGTRSDYSFGTGDFTIEAWVYTTTSGTIRTIIDTRSGDVLGNYYVGINASNQLFFIVFGSSIAGTLTVSPNTWTHVAVTRSSGSIRLFVDGSLSTTSAAAGVIDQGAVMSIGAGRSSAGNAISGYYLNGYIDDLRITKGVARYTSNFTPPPAPFPNV